MRRQAQIARLPRPVGREQALLSLEEGDAGFVLWQSGIVAFAQRIMDAMTANGMLAMEAQAIGDEILGFCEDF